MHKYKEDFVFKREYSKEIVVMRICPNCGATNSEADGNVCRKCGALLPISSQPPRMRISFGKKKDKAETQIQFPNNTSGIEIDHLSNQITAEAKFFATTKKKPSLQESNEFELNEIPKEMETESGNLEQDEKTNRQMQQDVDTFPPTPTENSQTGAYLKEIPVRPFEGSLITKKGVFGSPRVRQSENQNLEQATDSNLVADSAKFLDKEVSSPGISNKRPQVSSLPKKNILKEDAQPAINGSKSPKNVNSDELINDMQNVLSDLSSKLDIPEEEIKSNAQHVKAVPSKHDLAPNSMNEILENLLSLDLHIEAAAILKEDGSILASGISSMISDSLFGTIGKNLSSIGNDIIEWLNAGPLSNISIKGQHGILDVAPIDRSVPELENLILIIFSHPKAKRGIIRLAIGIVKKNIMEYLGIDKYTP